MATQNNAGPSHENPSNFVRNGIPVGPLQGYSAPLVVEEALTWLKEKRDPAKPFFLAVWTHEPHYPIKSDPKFKALYPELTDDVEREHHANVTQMDHAFGTLMKTLAEMKLSDDTFVFFTSDNGPEGDGIKSPGRGSNGGLRGRKRDMHEGGIRVPGMVRWPGKITPGQTLDKPVIGSDLFPTMLSVAGAKVPTNHVLDGVNILPMLLNIETPIERPQPLFWRLEMAPNAKMAMRTDSWKILANSDLTQFELYDLKKDPKETTDLKETEPARFAVMRQRLIEHNAAINAEGPDWWQRLDASGGRPKDAAVGPKARKESH
jgi:arylsulfatase A